MEPNKKISFGFNKLVKKPNVIQKKEEKKVELIDCLEGHSIKIKDAVEVINEPLVIPMKDDEKNLLDRIKKAKSQRPTETKDNKNDERPDSELSIEELAVREVIREAQNKLANKGSADNRILSLPTNEDGLNLDGEKESTLEDYENIPISDFGMAMLRGMGWKEGMGIGKNTTKAAAVSAPELRPKGLGLGASKLVADAPKNNETDKDGKPLSLVKGSYAKIIAGPQKGNFCEVLGFDDEAGRVIVKTAMKAEILNLNEFMLVPITKEQYLKDSRVLNNTKFEEYKDSEKYGNGNSQNTSEHTHKIKEETKADSSDEEKYRPNTSRRRSEKHSSRYSSGSDTGSKDEKYNKNQQKSRCTSSSSEEEYRRKRTEKKTKSSRRDRSRSRKKKSKSRHRRRSSSDEDRRSSRYKK